MDYNPSPFSFDFDEVFEKAMKKANINKSKGRTVSGGVATPGRPLGNQPLNNNQGMEKINRKVRRGKKSRQNTIGTRGMRLPSHDGGRRGRNRLVGRFKTSEFNRPTTSRQGTGLSPVNEFALEQALTMIKEKGL